MKTHAILPFVLEKRDQGYSLREIARLLEEEGVKVSHQLVANAITELDNGWEKRIRRYERLLRAEHITKFFDRWFQTRRPWFAALLALTAFRNLVTHPKTKIPPHWIKENFLTLSTLAVISAELDPKLKKEYMALLEYVQCLVNFYLLKHGQRPKNFIKAGYRRATKESLKFLVGVKNNIFEEEFFNFAKDILQLCPQT